VLVELRHAIADILAEQDKTGWATEEFEYMRCAEATPTRRDRWRRTSGIHKVRKPEALAAVRELWTVRDQIARSRDIAPGRILPDSAIVAAAMADPKTVEELTALPIFGGHKQRRSAKVWLAALEAARTNPDPPDTAEPQNGPPPAARWSKRKPEAAARLEAARSALAEVAARVNVPIENLVSPELVRRLCWDWKETADTTGAVATFLRDGGARSWQRELAVPALARALGTAPGTAAGTA
jgi:ribonuclease D